jgi:hypothetical protein
MLTPRHQRLKNLLIQLAGTDIGTYKVSDTQTVTAIKVVPPEPKPHWIPQGIEIVINRVPDIARQEGMHWNAVKRIEEWTVILTQYDRTEYDTLNSVCDRIMREFGSNGRMTYQPQSEKAYERANLYLQLARHLKGVRV